MLVSSVRQLVIEICDWEMPEYLHKACVNESVHKGCNIIFFGLEFKAVFSPRLGNAITSIVMLR